MTGRRGVTAEALTSLGFPFRVRFGFEPAVLGRLHCDHLNLPICDSSRKSEGCPGGVFISERP